MIGKLRTTHPTEGYGVIVGYFKSGKNIRITSISDSSGKDIWGLMPSGIIQEFKQQILM